MRVKAMALVSQRFIFWDKCRKIQPKNFQTAVIGFLLVYVITWTAFSYLLDPTVPYDAVEALNWARNGEFGSPKNPYMVGGVMLIGLGLESVIPLGLYWYLSHFVGAALGMFGIWRLSHRLFNNQRIALIAFLSLNLSGIINFDILPYNDNFLLVLFWPYMFLFFIKALYDDKRHWFSLAVVSGLAAMSKYSSFAFLPFMIIFSLLNPKTRQIYKTATPYVAILIFLILITPNAVWLFNHDFAAFAWVQSQVESTLNFDSFIAFLSVFYPGILVTLIFLFLGAKLQMPETEEKKAVVFSLMAPVSLIVLYFFLHSGGRITEWLQPFGMLASVAALSCLDFQTVKPLRRIALSFLSFSVLFCSGYALVMRANVGGAGSRLAYLKEMSREVNKVWRQKFNQPLKFVGGGSICHWLTFYAPDRPQVAIRWSNEDKPNIYNARLGPNDVLKDGVLLMTEHEAEYATIDFEDAKEQLPDVAFPESQDLFFRNEKRQLVKLRLAFAPPRRELLAESLPKKESQPSPSLTNEPILAAAQ